MDKFYFQCTFTIYFPKGFCLITKNILTYTKEEESCITNSSRPIIQIQQLSRFCHTCFKYPSFFFGWIISKQTPPLFSFYPKSELFFSKAIMPLSNLIKLTTIRCYHFNTRSMLTLFQLSNKGIFTVRLFKSDLYIASGCCV